MMLFWIINQEVNNNEMYIGACSLSITKFAPSYIIINYVAWGCGSIQ
jgi:hypothetical protein